MTGANFEGNTKELWDFMSRLKGVAAQAQAIGDDMLEGLRPNMTWYGDNDQYALSAGPQFKRTVGTLSDTLYALAQAVAAINNGRLEELKQIAGATNYALDQISQLQGKTDDVTNSPGGGKGH